MSMVAETVERGADRTSGADSSQSTRLLQRIRSEFLEMPGLKLTPKQARRIFGLDEDQSKALLKTLTADGFLIRDAHGAYGRRDASGGLGATGGRLTRRRVHESRAGETGAADLFDAAGVELPCLVCHGSYRVTLAEIRLSQLMMESGCQVRHFADCSPAAVAHLIEPSTLSEFEAAAHNIELAAAGAGGRLVRMK